MPSKLELFKQMSLVVDQLLDIAHTLNDAVMRHAGNHELEVLQERQSEIMNELGKIDQLIAKSPLGGTKEELDVWRLKIHEKLAQFQGVNQEFFNFIDSNRRVIEPSKLAQELHGFESEE